MMKENTRKYSLNIRISVKYIIFFSILCVLALFGCKKDNIPHNENVIKSANFSFFPNQLAANIWYKPGGSLINGHLDESFGDPQSWPQLLSNLKSSGGSFSLGAAEIGYLSTEQGLIPLLKKEGIPISVELPGFTQILSGTDLANAELNGKAVNGTDNIFSRIFAISNPTDRTDPDGKGWFFTNNRKYLIPDEILFDERQPNLCPQFDPKILAGTSGTWEERKAAARISNGYPYYTRPFNELLAGFRQDYLDFLQVAKVKWGEDMPEIGIHWNVNPGWEWRDQNAMDTIHARYPDYFNIASNFWRMVWDYPQYNSVEYCNQLVDDLTDAGFKPSRIIMDVDWTYNIPYIHEVLMRHKTALRNRDVQMAINVVEASIGDQEELYFDGTTLKRRNLPAEKPNVLYENTLVAIMEYLKHSGIYEEGMHIRVGSWSPRPYEIQSEVDENIPGSMAHAANQIFNML